jgi:sialic acid synthase SpsE
MFMHFKIKGKIYSPSNVMIIAELGTSHGGSLAKAKEMVCAAKEAGCDCVKFQIVYADEILHPNTGTVPLPGGDTKLYDIFKKLEVPLDFYLELKEYAEANDLLFLATPFGMRSADELFSLSPTFIKIASPELNYTGLLDKVSKQNIPVVLSAGVSKLADIENALSFFKQDVCLLHCITSYPAPPTEYNLNLLHNLSSIFKVAVGVSDHSLDPLIVPLLSVACGASIIEKHFCLSKKDGGLDDPIALVPEDFALMCNAVRTAHNQSAFEIIEDAKKIFTEEVVTKTLGDGVKKLAPSEIKNYERTNRSIHSLIKIKKGDVFSKNNIAVLRTEKILRVGLHPSYFDKLLGRKAMTDIPAGEGIRFDDI